MGFGRSKSCRRSSTPREICDEAQPPRGGGARRRRPMSLLCSLHSSCLVASSSTSHDSDDDDEVCNGWMRKSNGSISRRRMESRNQRDGKNCYDKELKDEKKSENERHRDELEIELDDDCGVEEEEAETLSNVQMRNIGGLIQESSTPGRVFSHFKFIPGNRSSRLSRASSSRSFNTTYPVSSPRQTIEREEGVTSHSESAIRLIDRVESPRFPLMDNVVRDSDAMRHGVLDVIHQQSVVLSSQQPSVSSIGSVPAPNDVVDLLPMKVYTKSQSEDSTQCYVCLVEYEEGDTIKTLPCHHEFHRTCVDKWLKEIHRVCPLCRGDICRHDPSSHLNNIDYSLTDNAERF